MKKKEVIFEKELRKISNIHENREEDVDYVKFVNNFSLIQQQAIEYAWKIIHNIYQDQIDINDDYLDDWKRIQTICLEQIIWIIEFEGGGVTSWKNEVVKWEKNIYNSFINIKNFKDVQSFVVSILKYFIEWHWFSKNQDIKLNDYSIKILNEKYKNIWNKITKKSTT